MKQIFKILRVLSQNPEIGNDQIWIKQSYHSKRKVITIEEGYNVKDRITIRIFSFLSKDRTYSLNPNK